MSDDIVKRLRSQAHADEYAGSHYDKLHFPLLRDAADEIERLRDEVRRLRAAQSHFSLKIAEG